MITHAEPVGGPILTRPMKVLLAVAISGLAIFAWRFAAGLGAVTDLSDGYPWGLWIAFDVVTGTALACGGYAVALLVYVLNRGRYHPLVRPAVLTSALGYSLAAVAIVVDVGRPWYLWKIPLRVADWNLDSALLEVALCVMAYVVVLWIELAPAFLERWQGSARPGLARLARRGRPILDKALLWILALGVLLPTMHQSSLGTVMLLAGFKLDPLWASPVLPLLFLVSCLGMGYAAVVFEGTLAAAVFHRRLETPMLSALFGPATLAVVLFLVLRWVDVVYRGLLGRAFAFDLPSVMFLAETVLFAVPVGIYLRSGRRRDPGRLFRAALLLMLAGALYRFDTYLVAFDPGPGWSYFPSVPEMWATVGLVALEVLVYVAIVKRFPILAGRPPAAAAP